MLLVLTIEKDAGAHSLTGLGCCCTGFPDLRRLILESVGRVGEVCTVLAVGNAYWLNRIVGISVKWPLAPVVRP